MTIVVSLLRGINVGGKRSLKMAELVDLYQSLRLANPRSHIQSGNVIFGTDEDDLDGLARRIMAAIEKRFGMRIDVILRTSDQMKQVIDTNPFAGRLEIHSNKLIVMFLTSDPGPEARDRLRNLPPAPEEFHLSGRELYAWYPNGMGGSKTSQSAIDRALKVPGTARNWNTVARLYELAAAHKV
jgi:uncharacterized protein (DUF1697 family)